MFDKKALKREYLILTVILILTLSQLIYWGLQKQGYHVDEMYMYGTSNSEYLPFMHLGTQEYSVRDWMHTYGGGSNIIDLFRNLASDVKIIKDSDWKLKNTVIYEDYLRARENSNDMYTPSWMTGNDYVEYLTATPGSRFNYLSVMYNFRGDNHPPFYAMLLHTVCSFFPGVYSKWFGLGLNAVIVLLTVLLIYKTVKDYLGGTTAGLVTAAVYGLSAAAANSATFIRMYCLLVFMTVGMCYAHLAMHSNGWKLDRKKRWTLILFTFFGYYTQYYFVFFAFVIALVSAVIMVIRKKYKELFGYIVTMACTAVAGVVLWPFSIKAVFGGSRGAESISGLFSAGGLQRLSIMFGTMASRTFGVSGFVFGIIILFFAGILVLYIVRRSKEQGYGPVEKAALLAIPVVLYLVTVSKMVPFLVDRYIMCLFPICFMLAVSCVTLLTKCFGYSKKVEIAIVLFAGVVLLPLSCSLRIGNAYLFRGGQETDTVSENTDCIYLMPGDMWNESTEDVLLLSKCRNVAVARVGEHHVLYGTYSAESGSSLLLVLRDGVSETELVSDVLNNFPEEGSSLVFTEKRRTCDGDRTLILYEVSD